MNIKPIFYIETNTGDLLNAIKRVSGIIKAKGGRIKGNRLIFIDVDDSQFRIYVDNISDSIPTVNISGKGKVSLNFNTTLKAIKTYPKIAVLTVEAFPDFLLLNGNLQLNEQYSSAK